MSRPEPRPSPAREAPLRWLELSPGFACNCRCLGCHSCSADASDQMAPAEVLHWLQHGRRLGARHLWLSGGEPTLRKDFLGTLRAARQLGYQRIKVQTNAMLLSYAQFADKALAAGMTEVNLLLKSMDPKIHDGLNRTPRSHQLLGEAIEVLRPRNVRLEGDILVTTRNLHEMPALVAHYAALGLRHFNIWLFSLVDQGDADLRRLVPRLDALVPVMLEAWRVAQAHGATLCSLNTPHCALPSEAWPIQFDAAGMGLLVVNPGGRAFRLETSSIEQGEYVAACETCAVRPWCHGMRADYLAVHGEAELRPVAQAALAGHDPRGSVLDL
ncbi:MAG: radical SAM protein [Deltaproteobacteria bacterium]|nr:radical SAM protein [Deltaproteobacteria bacterium]